MSDPKYNKYAGTVRFDDDNIVDIDLQPDTENITVKLNGEEVTGGSGLPEVDSSDNGDVLTVVSGEWTNAAPASQLPAVSGSDNGNVLTVVEGVWAKAAPPAPAAGAFKVVMTEDETTGDIGLDKTYAEIYAAIQAGMFVYVIQDFDDGSYAYYPVSYADDGMVTFNGFPEITSNGIGITLYILDDTDTLTDRIDVYPEQ